MTQGRGSFNKHLIGIVVGARPNFVKAAPLVRRLRESSHFTVRVIHSGQHYDEKMSKIFLEQLGIGEPDTWFQSQNHSPSLAEMIDNLTHEFSSYDFSGIFVFGDVNSTLAAGIAATKVKLQKPKLKSPLLIHVEAGLRSFDYRMPEEINRIAVDHLADICFTTEESADRNLLKEGIDSHRIFRVGNLMIENLIYSLPAVESVPVKIEGLDADKQLILATIHRKENLSDFRAITRIMEMLSEVSKVFNVVFPVHPGTMKVIKNLGLEGLLSDLIPVSPLGYFEFISLLKGSAGVISDSGGIQEEASILGVPCCTIRDNTERPITIEKGTNRLFALDTLQSAEVVNHLQKVKCTPSIIPLWDNQVSARMEKVLRQVLSVEDEVERLASIKTGALPKESGWSANR